MSNWNWMPACSQRISTRMEQIIWICRTRCSSKGDCLGVGAGDDILPSDVGKLSKPCKPWNKAGSKRKTSRIVESKAGFSYWLICAKLSSDDFCLASLHAEMQHRYPKIARVERRYILEAICLVTTAIFVGVTFVDILRFIRFIRQYSSNSSQYFKFCIGLQNGCFQKWGSQQPGFSY